LLLIGIPSLSGTFRGGYLYYVIGKEESTLFLRQLFGDGLTTVHHLESVKDGFSGGQRIKLICL